jgi:hypothetical protein
MSKDFVEDGLTNEKIFEIVDDIRKEIEKDIDINELKKKHMFFYERYPSLFENVTKKNFDNKSFEYMMKMREKIINDMTTSEEASKEIGVKFYNKYQKK